MAMTACLLCESKFLPHDNIVLTYYVCVIMLNVLYHTIYIVHCVIH